MIILGTFLLNIYSFITNKINELLYPELHNCDESYYSKQIINSSDNTCDSIKILSYNVNNYYNSIWQNRKAQILDYIKKSGADVVCLQESNENIQSKLNSEYKNYIKMGGQIILTNHNIEDIDIYEHPIIKGRELIKTIIIKLKMSLNDKEVIVNIANIHFSSDLLLYEQNKNLKEIITYTKNLDNVILVGDFNLPKIKNLPVNVFTFNTDSTYPSIIPILTLDRIIYKGISLYNCIIDKEIIYSDHYPLLCELSFNNIDIP
jgi:endonuclease/exonuclease/phosphatase family metal-dependent hydrolase